MRKVSKIKRKYSDEIFLIVRSCVFQNFHNCFINGCRYLQQNTWNIILPWIWVKYIFRVPLPDVIHGGQIPLEGGSADWGATGEDEHLEDAVHGQQTQQSHQVADEHAQEMSTEQRLSPVWWYCLWLSALLFWLDRHYYHHYHSYKRKYLFKSGKCGMQTSDSCKQRFIVLWC